MTPEAPTVILITDPRFSLAHITHVINVAARAAPGALLVQLRVKTAAAGQLERAGRTLREACVRAGARFVVNAATEDALHVALEVGADGAHVPCHTRAIEEARAKLGTSAWISTPAHSDDDVAIAAGAGATGVLVSPIWESPGKGPARGPGALAGARRAAGELLVYALGGVDVSRAAACADAGADGVAVIRALLEVDDPAAAARGLDAPFQNRGLARQ